MKSYNGHRSWNAWNVSLWINNDYSMYQDIVETIKKYGAYRAAQVIKSWLPAKTPDGAFNNLLSIRLAIRDMV